MPPAETGSSAMLAHEPKPAPADINANPSKQRVIRHLEPQNFANFDIRRNQY
jgi:hypothetical protein